MFKVVHCPYCRGTDEKGHWLVLDDTKFAQMCQPIAAFTTRVLAQAEADTRNAVPPGHWMNTRRPNPFEKL